MYHPFTAQGRRQNAKSIPESKCVSCVRQSSICCEDAVLFQNVSFLGRNVILIEINAYLILFLFVYIVFLGKHQHIWLTCCWVYFRETKKIEWTSVCNFFINISRGFLLSLLTLLFMYRFSIIFQSSDLIGCRHR